MSFIQRRVRIFGRVQGVGFRAATAIQASHFTGLKGYVMNLEEGSVEAVFMGDEKSVLEMTAWCQKGPTLARVDRLEVKEEPTDSSLTAFKIKN